jgi:magnesium-transporting ATPase (P-type)
LNKEDAEMRLQVYGRNELTKPPPEPCWKVFLEQFSDLLVIMLIVASIISAALGEYPAAVTIILIVLANAILGFVQVCHELPFFLLFRLHLSFPLFSPTLTGSSRWCRS